MLEPEIRLVADADDGREPELLGKAPVDDGGDDRTALGDEGDVPRPRGDGVERCVDPHVRHHDPETVRADDPDGVPLCNRRDLLFENRAFTADLAEPGGDDDRETDAFLPALLHHLRDDPGGHGDDRPVDRARDIQNGGVGLPPEEFASRWVDRIEVPGEREQVPEDGVAHLVRACGGADHGNGFRVEDVRGCPNPEPGGRAPGGIPDDDPRIDDADAVLVDDDGVQVELPDPGVFDESLCHRGDDADERLLVLRGLSPVSPDEPVAFNLTDHGTNLGVGDGQHADGDIFEEFHQFPPETERDDLPERRVGLPADQHLEPRGHLSLDDDPGDRRLRGTGGGVLHDCSERLFGPIGALDPGDDSADVAFVDDLRGDDLHDDGIAYSPGGHPCIPGTGGEMMGRHRYPARFEKAVALRFG